MQSNDFIQDRYGLEGRIGQGGMAEVWHAFDSRLARPVAIKFLDKRLLDSPEFLVRFFSEAQAAAAISHPHVVKVLDFGRAQEAPYLVMEYVEGGTLADLLETPLTLERATELLSQAAAGAGALHSSGLVHRDIKPANILIDGAGNVRLTDLGIAARENTESLTGTGSTIGSPYYMAPERIHGEEGDARADVYALGIVLYESLTGTRPFEGNNLTSIAVAQLEREPHPPSELAPSLPPEIDALILRCLAKEPTDRFADGYELAHALVSWSSRTAVGEAAAPGPFAEEAEGPQNPKVISGALLIALLLAAAGLAAVFSDSAGPTPADAGPGPSPAATRKAPSPTPSPTTEGSAVPAAAEPTPSSTPSGGGNKKEAKETSSEPEPSPTPEKEETEPSPTPEPSPTSEPSPEASPATKTAPSPSP